MRTRGALALRSPSSWIFAHDGRRGQLSPFLEPLPRRASAPAPVLAPSPPTVRIYIISSAPARPDGRSGKIPSKESDFVEHASSHRRAWYS
eukprot:2212599-Pleurochrysis_carterae.AAC.1